MTSDLARRLVVQTVASVTGDDLGDVAEQPPTAVDARDWDQIIGRLEAICDVDLHAWSDHRRVIDIDALAAAIVARAVPLAG